MHLHTTSLIIRPRPSTQGTMSSSRTLVNRKWRVRVDNLDKTEPKASEKFAGTRECDNQQFYGTDMVHGNAATKAGTSSRPNHVLLCTTDEAECFKSRIPFQSATIDRLEERGAERGSARRSSLKGRERAIVTQTNIGTVSKAKLGKLLRVTG